MKTWRLAVVLLLAIAGAAIAAHLIAIHNGHVCRGVPGACAFSESSTCDEVNTSKWSELAGVPVAHLGMLTYLLVIGIAGAALFRASFRPRAHAYLFLVAIWCVMFSAWMAFVAVFKIGKLCDWCVSLYALNVVSLCVVFAGGFKAAAALPEHLADERRWLRRPSGALLIVACLAFVAGSSAYLRSYLNGCRREQIEKKVGIDTAGRPSMGPEAAPVTIVEISDFECPFCRKASGTLMNVLEGFKGRVRLVFVNNPLDQACNPNVHRPFHKKACEAARAAHCAGKRGFFWPYAKKLFGGDLDRASLLSYAKGFGFPEAAFVECIESAEAAQAVARDIEACSKVKNDGVPVFLINGRKLVGARPPDEFKKVIEEELAAAR